MKAKNDLLKQVCKFLYYFTTALGSLLLGVGTLLLGVGGMIALSHTDTVLMKILEIKDILFLMRQEQKANYAKKIFATNDALSSKNASFEQIKSALELIPNDIVDEKGTVILKKDNIDTTAKALYDTKDVNKRVYILEHSLDYISAESKR